MLKKRARDQVISTLHSIRVVGMRVPLRQMFMFWSNLKSLPALSAVDPCLSHQQCDQMDFEKNHCFFGWNRLICHLKNKTEMSTWQCMKTSVKFPWIKSGIFDPLFGGQNFLLIYYSKALFKRAFQCGVSRYLYTCSRFCFEKFFY